MATDGNTPAPCDKQLFNNGVQIAVFGEVGGSNRFERLIQTASREAGVPIDWHFSGGRAVVLAFKSDLNKACLAIDKIVRPVIEGDAPTGCFNAEDERKW